MTPPGLDPLPNVVAHADWSVAPRKRWVAVALLGRDGRYRALLPRLVGDLPVFLDGLAARAGPFGSVFLGLDLPIGLPAAYAERAGIDDFRSLLPRLGRGRWRDFFEVAERPSEISLTRPFYPARPGARGAVSRRHLVAGLGLESFDDLLRRCDRATPARPAASAIFWTLGPQQVGKAAIGAWRDLFGPALAGGRDLAIWPFDGRLDGLFAPGRVVVAETYPAEVYGHLGVVFRRTGKRARSGRAANAEALFDRAGDLGVVLEAPLGTAIEDGFGPESKAEDPFDATVGLLGMLGVALGRRPAGEPRDSTLGRVEGWILGQTPALAD